MGARREKRKKRCGPERQKCSKAAHSQEGQKVQQKRGVAKRGQENLQNAKRGVIKHWCGKD